MDTKQAPPAYSEAATAGSGNANQGYAPPPGNHQGYPMTQAGYPQGYSHPQGVGYAPQPAPGAYGGQQMPPPPPGYYTTTGQPGQPGGYSYNQTVVVAQPMGGRPLPANSVPDHMGLAIFTTLCCCWPLGLVAIMRAQESRRALERGDLGSARTYSSEARRFSIWAIAGGCLSIIITTIVLVVYVTSALNSSY